MDNSVLISSQGSALAAPDVALPVGVPDESKLEFRVQLQMVKL